MSTHRNRHQVKLFLALAAILVVASVVTVRSCAVDALPCRDGTRSPTCRVGDASAAGCCSSHGGVRR